MSEYIIDVKNLNKTFKVAQKKQGLLSSVRSLVNRKYKEVSAVNNINFQVKKGEIRGLIGPNGAGKSTTIKMLCGILYPTSGQVNIMGFEPWSERVRYVKKIGAVFGQKSQLWWDLPPIDTFYLNKEMYKIEEKRFKENLDYLVELLDINKIINTPVRQLSLGERMKCELVCALLHDPGLIFLDEPTIGLDVVSKENIRNFIKQLNHDKKTTFILTTHDVEDIEDLCDNITIINNGTVVFDNTLEKLRTYFSSKKIVDLKFGKAVSKEMLSKYNVTAFDGLSSSIEIDVSKNNLNNEISEILKGLPVKDINISSISIEEVIKEIFTNSK